ncbi:MAG: radical SAM family heme chaperone HemW [Deltaproteobacteria bacterium]|nr:radical SAM family heme chaperone HemW [Deltaproteobacteria bacterium]
MNRLGIYVHIPYCLQICTYCDFVKFESKDLPPPRDYISLLALELSSRREAFTPIATEVHSIYFGGGTPSLFSPQEILSVLDEIEKNGLKFRDRLGKLEITLEINPGTIDLQSLELYLKMGISRFSVGAQTFDESLLVKTGRKHTVQETVETLELLANKGVNYSFDLLFGLPGQSLEGVQADVRRAMMFSPSHISAYNLTVPTGHPLNRGRASDDVQAEMFSLIESELAQGGITRYEVSNFAKPGFESQHNLLYWTDQPYWGLGIGAHSYIPGDGSRGWGSRFWNPATVRAYQNELALISGREFFKSIPKERNELLALNELLTDFSHTSLRRMHGLSETMLVKKFGPRVSREVEKLIEARLRPLIDSGLVLFEIGKNGKHWRLSPTGLPLADRVFETLTFLKDEIPFKHPEV